MKRFNLNEDSCYLPDLIRASIEYINQYHNDIDDGVFYLPQSNLKVIKLNYTTEKEKKIYVYESHNKINDVHFIYSGDESVSVAQEVECELTDEYNEEGDYTLYRSRHFTKIKLQASDVIIFSPKDLHSTGIKNQSDTVIKYVIKLPLDLSLEDF